MRFPDNERGRIQFWDSLLYQKPYEAFKDFPRIHRGVFTQMQYTRGFDQATKVTSPHLLLRLNQQLDLAGIPQDVIITTTGQFWIAHANPSAINEELFYPHLHLEDLTYQAFFEQQLHETLAHDYENEAALSLYPLNNLNEEIPCLAWHVRPSDLQSLKTLVYAVMELNQQA